MEIFNEIAEENRDVPINKVFDANGSNIDIILPCGKSGTFIHEAIGHCLEGDTFYASNTFWDRKLNMQLTSNTQVNISDIASIEGNVMCKHLDDGTVCKDVEIVKNGYLNAGLKGKYNFVWPIYCKSYFSIIIHFFIPYLQSYAQSQA